MDAVVEAPYARKPRRCVRFPHNEPRLRGSGTDVEMKLRMRPDYHDGEVLEHHPSGVTLVKEPAYSTSIEPRRDMKDLGGVSGGR